MPVYGGAVGLLPTAAAEFIPHWRLQWGATEDGVENVTFLPT